MRERWPRLLREIAQELGNDAALKLVAAYGGKMITIPRKAAGSTLEAKLGGDLAVLLVDLHGGDSIDIPNFAARLAAERRRFVLTNAHLSANDCAGRLGVTRQRILQIRREARPDPDQGDLFTP